MHFPMTGKIYLHYDDAFALDINFLRFVGYLQPWDKPSNDICSEKKTRKTLNSFTGFMKVSDPVPYEQSNQGITDYFFHDIIFCVHLDICSGRHKLDI